MDPATAALNCIAAVMTLLATPEGQKFLEASRTGLGAEIVALNTAIRGLIIFAHDKILALPATPPKA